MGDKPEVGIPYILLPITYMSSQFQLYKKKQQPSR